MEQFQISAQELTALAEDLLQNGKYVEIPTRGYSMRPMLAFEGSHVRLTAPKTIKRGDVALYRYPNGICALHRIIQLSKDGTLICLGDGNLRAEHIRREWVIGIMTDFNRRNRWVSADAPGYRLYVWIWMALWPLRRIAIPIWQTLKRHIKGARK